MNGSTEPWIRGRPSTVGVLHLLRHTHKPAGLRGASVTAHFAALADSFSCQALPTLGKAAVPVLPQSSPFLMRDESFLSLTMKVLSPACYRLICSGSHLMLPSGRREILANKIIGLNCSQFLIFTTGTISAPTYNAPLGWRVISLRNLHSHSSFFCIPPPLCLPRLLPEPLTNICFSSSCTDWDTVWRSVQSIILSQAHTLRRQQVSTRLLPALTTALRHGVQI